jgi:hypothetical protein
MPATGELPVLIRFMLDGLKYKSRQRGKINDFEFFLIDLSSWKLRLSDRTPFFSIEARHLASLDPSTLASSIKTAIEKQYYTERTTVLMIDGVSPSLQEKISALLPYCVLLDAQEINKIVGGPVAEKPLIDLIVQKIPLASLSPYEITSAVSGSQFFGREYELRIIRSHPTTDYVILGTRRIGKTSLLKELKRLLHESEESTESERDESRIIYCDCSKYNSASDYMLDVVDKVDSRQIERMTPANFPRFLRWKSYRGKRPLLFLLDEFDQVIEFDQLENWALLKLLHASSQEGYCHYILAGYRSTMECCLEESSPLFNLVTPITLGNLSQKDTRQLITVPLSNMGVTIKRPDDFIAQIYHETAGHPNIVQFYCSTLVQIVDRAGCRMVSSEDLALVERDPEFERFIFRSFYANTNHLEKAIVFALVGGCQRFTPEELQKVMAQRGVYVTGEHILRACDHLRVAGIFERGQDNSRTYMFAIPVLTRLLKEFYDIDALFEDSRKEGHL